MVKNIRNRLLTFFLLALWCSAGSSHERELSSLDVIENIEGVYKHRFTNSLVTGEKYQSEDIVEIVRYSSDAIYFRVKLAFYNGHGCGIYGIAKYSEGAFVYKDSFSSDPKEICTLKVIPGQKVLSITDTVDENVQSTCSRYCGARGSLTDYEIEMEKKRKIRYMPIILKSVQYLEAVEEYEDGNGKK